MSQKILCVDDEPNILDGFNRTIGKKFDLVSATDPKQALDLLGKEGPFAVVVTDLRMPSMNGIELLTAVKRASPDTVRILLTGNADLQTAIEAINSGQIFRFLTKPCPSETLAASLMAGLEQHRLITSEKILLEQTLTGIVKVLSDILTLVNSDAFGRSFRITRLVEAMAHHLAIDNVWPLRTAALLSQIGCVTVPEDVLKKVREGIPLSPHDAKLFNEHPKVAGDLLKNVPRMEYVEKIIAMQELGHDEVRSDQPDPGAIPMEARILKVALDFDGLQQAGMSKAAAFNRLKQRKIRYDNSILEALKVAFAKEIKYELKGVVVAELAAGMILAEHLLSSKDILLAPKGTEISDATIVRLRNFRQFIGVREPFMVLDPVSRQIEEESDQSSLSSAV